MNSEHKNTSKKVAVIGGGSWATAIVKILMENDVNINWWMRSETDVKHILKYWHNPSYLSTVEVHKDWVTPTTHIKEALEGVDMIFLVVPSSSVDEVLANVPEVILRRCTIVSAVKGMEPSTNLLVTDYLISKFNIPPSNIAVIAGPCHAEEVAMERQSYLTIASEDLNTAETVVNVLKCRFIKANAITDVIGVEYSAVIKNIVSIACGIAGGLKYGDNFQAVLVSNAMQEIRRFVHTVSPIEREIDGSAYLGDLLVTTYSKFSRNRTFGYMLGRGYSVRSAQMEMEMVAEGYYAVKSLQEINKKFQVNMPITNAVYHVAYEKISPIIEFRILEEKLS